MLALSLLVPSSYPVSYTNCGVTNTLTSSPQRVVTMTQGATEFMLAMGLQDKMVGTAYLDDAIWPRYAAAYNNIPVLASGYPTEAQIMGTNADFILGSFRSAFRERTWAGTRYRGIFSNQTVAPCDGENSDFFPAGSNSTMSYSTCRPQLHANGIGTWLDSTSCEDSALRPTGGASEETVYAAVRQIGSIFNVPAVAEMVVSEIRNDFQIAENTVRSLSRNITAVWLDCIGCCRDANGDRTNELLFIGAGSGAPNLIMQEAGMTNAFGHIDASWSCVSVSDIIAAAPDVMVVVDASWDPAITKIDFMHNHSGFCDARFVQRADYITIPFSASTLGPRNGAAALDMVNAAIHVTTGATTMNFESGVTFFDPAVLEARTAGMMCPITSTAYDASSTTAASPTLVSEAAAQAASDTNGGMIAVLIVAIIFVVLFIATALFAFMMFKREKEGKPIFSSLNEVEMKK